ncbi:hypothetical protein VCRA2121O157_50071 [Vibrio crassostreae]|nr:hypothetical protein VCRA2113O204_100013 [Vibrio crassostreae]CAK1692879.1 hypothetical protein VCRA2113O201_100013 [Vibrio crassostreae]CAK1696839.1 hypothetical protein VCRA2113O228_100047 [Vibrio crassostreae]CAK1705198.1 hypothetical protein VCRA2113O206_100118 [Vibrio crassostreae]CAK1706760.1 hypothetical protein VCRA2110O178_100138 [Vibrio crassostreae]
MLFLGIGKYSESFYFFEKFIGDYYLSLTMMYKSDLCQLD